MDCKKCIHHDVCDLNSRLSGNTNSLMYDDECKLFKEKCDLVIHKITLESFSFEYGIVVYKHRFSIKRSLNSSGNDFYLKFVM